MMVVAVTGSRQCNARESRKPANKPGTTSRGEVRHRPDDRPVAIRPRIITYAILSSRYHTQRCSARVQPDVLILARMAAYTTYLE